jgi:hypothetical protein
MALYLAEGHDRDGLQEGKLPPANVSRVLPGRRELRTVTRMGAMLCQCW